MAGNQKRWYIHKIVLFSRYEEYYQAIKAGLRIFHHAPRRIACIPEVPPIPIFRNAIYLVP